MANRFKILLAMWKFWEQNDPKEINEDYFSIREKHLDLYVMANLDIEECEVLTPQFSNMETAKACIQDLKDRGLVE